MLVKLEPDEKLAEKIFLKDLHDFNPEERREIMAAGMVTDILFSKNTLAVFVLDDTTSNWICEFFTDKCSYPENFQAGSQIIIRGDFSQNKYKEKVIKVYKMRVIDDVNEEYYFYLEIQRERLNKKKAGHLGKAEDHTNQDQIKNLPEDILIRKFTSAIIEYLFDHADKSLVDTHTNNLKDIKMLENYKKKFGDEKFEDIFIKAIKRCVETGVLHSENKADHYKLNLNQVEDFDDRLFRSLCQDYAKTDFEFKYIYKMANQQLDTNTFLLSQETVYKILEKLFVRRLIYPLESQGGQKNSYGILR